MKSLLSLPAALIPTIIALLVATTNPLVAEQATAPIDDFSNVDTQPTGAPRMVITDAQAGGQSTATVEHVDGVMQVSGQLAPGRGAPGFVSIPLVLNPDGSGRDLSAHTGVVLRVKISSGTLQVQACGSDITNFDYHISAPLSRDPGDFREVRVPFAAMRRAWSEQTPLNLHSITSINLVVAGMAPGPFAYAVDSVGLY